ncbi:MAG: DUF1634 domain-containing protein [Myxococcales bacterium]|nr:DUF1634 domain-containing protein [Myxococcales bacterium]
MQGLLRGGLAVAVVLMVVGLVVQVASGEVAAPGVPLRALVGTGVSPGTRLMGLGVLALGLTPGLRVVLLLVLWARERDWRFVGVAALVVMTLAVSLALGGG